MRALPDRVILAGIALAVAGAAAVTASAVINVHFFGGRVDHLDANLEGNAFTWASSVATFTAALSALALASCRPSARRRLASLAGILAFFSLDDVVGIHEALGREVAWEVLGLPKIFLLVVWPALYLPLVASAFLLLWSVARGPVPPAVRRSLQLGLVLLVVAFATEPLQTLVFAFDHPLLAWPRVLVLAFEEGTELAACLLIASALTANACQALAGLGPARTPSRTPLRR